MDVWTLSHTDRISGCPFRWSLIPTGGWRHLLWGKLTAKVEYLVVLSGDHYNFDITMVNVYQMGLQTLMKGGKTCNQMELYYIFLIFYGIILYFLNLLFRICFATWKQKFLTWFEDSFNVHQFYISIALHFGIAITHTNKFICIFKLAYQLICIFLFWKDKLWILIIFNL